MNKNGYSLICSLSKFYFCLPVASLIELLAEVLDAQQNLFGKRVQPMEKWLKRYLKSGFILRYERRKEIASDETVGTQTVQPFVLTPTLVSTAIPLMHCS